METAGGGARNELDKLHAVSGAARDPEPLPLSNRCANDRVSPLYRSVRSGRSHQPANRGRKSLNERVPMALPSPRVRQMNDGTVPVCHRASLRDIAGDRAEHGSDDCRLKLSDSPRERSLSSVAGSLPRPRIQAIYGLRTQIGQVAARGLEHREKIVIVDRWIDASKCISHSPVKSGVAGVKEASGSGWRFADKQKLNVRRPKDAPQLFSIAPCSKRHLGACTIRTT
jgi:hypothetical protein